MNPALATRVKTLQRDLEAQKTRVREDLLKFAPAATAMALITLGEIMLLRLEETTAEPHVFPKGIRHDLDELEGKMRQPVTPHAAMNADAIRLLMVIAQKLYAGLVNSGEWREEE